MSEIPNTDDIRIAALAAAQELAKRSSDDRMEDFFEARLGRFLTAYRAIMIAHRVGSHDPADINVEEIMAGQKYQW